MGWDITAWVKVQFPWRLDEEPDAAWMAIVDASLLLNRSYDAFGSLAARRPCGRMAKSGWVAIASSASQTWKTGIPA